MVNGKSNSDSAGKIVIERTYLASMEDIWELWTTKEGIESWWGPDGFSVKVHELDLRVGGEMRYAIPLSNQRRSSSWNRQACLSLSRRS